MLNRYQCIHCQSEDPINFVNWNSARQPTDENFDTFRALSKVQDIKSGSIYQSRCCDSRWYLDQGVFMYLLTPYREEVLKRWVSRDLRVPDRLRFILNGIGYAKFSELYNESRDYPCAIKFKDGTENHFCIVNLTTLPPDFDPIGKSNLRFRYMDEVADVFPSKYALPQFIRNVTMDGWKLEVRMGCYASTYVKIGTHIYEVPAFQSFVPIEIFEKPSIVSASELESLGFYEISPIQPLNVVADPF